MSGFKLGAGSTPKCKICTKTVYKMEEVIAIGATWHKLCFTCGGDTKEGCGRVLSIDNYNDHGSNPYCNACYGRLYRPKGVGFGNTLNTEEGHRTMQFAAEPEKEEIIPSVDSLSMEPAPVISTSSKARGAAAIAAAAMRNAAAARENESLLASFGVPVAPSPSPSGGNNTINTMGIEVATDFPVGKSTTYTAAAAAKASTTISSSLSSAESPSSLSSSSPTPSSAPSSNISAFSSSNTSSATTSPRAAPTATAASAATTGTSASTTPSRYENLVSSLAEVSAPSAMASSISSNSDYAGYNRPSDPSGQSDSSAKKRLSIRRSFTEAPKCNGCNTSVYKAEEVVVDGLYWHKTCFKCGGKDAGVDGNVGCGRGLTSATSHNHENIPYCNPCYGREFRIKGVGYGTYGSLLSTALPSTPDAVKSEIATETAKVSEGAVSSMLSNFPSNSSSSSSSSNSPSTVSSNPAGASSPAGKAPVRKPSIVIGTTGPKCKVCLKTVYKMEEIVAISHTWHKQCFQCGGTTAEGCKRVLTIDNYSDHGSNPYCNACYGKLYRPKGVGYGGTLNTEEGHRTAIHVKYTPPTSESATLVSRGKLSTPNASSATSATATGPPQRRMSNDAANASFLQAAQSASASTVAQQASSSVSDDREVEEDEWSLTT